MRQAQQAARASTSALPCSHVCVVASRHIVAASRAAQEASGVPQPQRVQRQGCRVAAAGHARQRRRLGGAGRPEDGSSGWGGWWESLCGFLLLQVHFQGASRCVGTRQGVLSRGGRWEVVPVRPAGCVRPGAYCRPRSPRAFCLSADLTCLLPHPSCLASLRPLPSPCLLCQALQRPAPRGPPTASAFHPPRPSPPCPLLHAAPWPLRCSDAHHGDGSHRSCGGHAAAGGAVCAVGEVRVVLGGRACQMNGVGMPAVPARRSLPVPAWGWHETRPAAALRVTSQCRCLNARTAPAVPCPLHAGVDLFGLKCGWLLFYPTAARPADPGGCAGPGWTHQRAVPVARACTDHSTLLSPALASEPQRRTALHCAALHCTACLAR